MRITLINCKPKLEAQGIFMDEANASQLLSERLAVVIPYNSLDYFYFEDMIRIYPAEEVEEIPDLSAFGEVVDDGFTT